MEEDIVAQLTQLRALYSSAAPTDVKTQERYAWTACKAISKHADTLGGTLCRQLLADIMRLPLARRSSLYSSVLWAATKVAQTYADFHFVPFLNMWNPTENLRDEDYQAGRSDDGKSFPSLSERMTRCCLIAQAVRPEEKPNFNFEIRYGFHPLTEMIVTKVTQSEVKGRKMFFASLVSADGTEVMTEAHTLRPNPTTPSDKRHYVNVGQLYNAVLRDKTDGTGIRLIDGVLSSKPIEEAFRVVTGYVESIDATHDHIHIYDGLSRHFVNSGQRFVKAQKGDFVRFVPIVPLTSKFKSAIIVNSNMPATDLFDSFPPREIRITSINEEKQYLSWELVDATKPITEQLSALQLSQGETSPSFTKGFMNLDTARSMIPSIATGQTLRAIIYLRRGKDGQKRPFVALLR